jgi:hypothetical protein
LAYTDNGHRICTPRHDERHGETVQPKVRNYLVLIELRITRTRRCWLNVDTTKCASPLPGSRPTARRE